MEMTSISEQLADAVARAGEPPREIVEKLLIDVAGLCVAARNTDYVRAALAGWEASGHCTALGHARALDSAGAAFVNGTAAHGEDFDDTFEGGPVHAGAVIVPAVLALAEREKISGKDALRAIAVGVELTCRASMVAPKMIHKAGFHPTAVLGAMGAAAASAVAMKLSRTHFVNALGIAGSMASGIIEYLAEGTWTKRMHPGWAAQSGIRAADLARHGFIGPRTVFEGEHGFLRGFANTTKGAWDRLVDGFGKTWVTETVAFKLYPCGTMTHPYIDCARRLSAKIDPDQIEEIVCEAAEGTLHRLWEPLAAKQRPPNAYAGKFSTPYCIAAGFVLGNAGLDAFTDERVADPRLRAIAGKVRYEVDPDNPYPNEYTGHVRVRLRDGSVLEERQAHIRGGKHEPLSRADVEEKFRGNCAYGGWSAAQADAFLAWAKRAFDSRALDLSPFRTGTRSARRASRPAPRPSAHGRKGRSRRSSRR
jgi:2-methylcitrate dehydratase PrpD